MFQVARADLRKQDVLHREERDAHEESECLTIRFDQDLDKHVGRNVMSESARRRCQDQSKHQDAQEHPSAGVVVVPSTASVEPRNRQN